MHPSRNAIKRAPPKFQERSLHMGGLEQFALLLALPLAACCLLLAACCLLLAACCLLLAACCLLLAALFC